MTIRKLDRLIRGVATSDGAGVKLTRTLGSAQHQRLDPFLMLDEFASDDAEDYIAGFPSHPHRGFETVTYMLDGHMLHEDHMGNRGDLRPGDVQWMTAGRGVIHSEMPQQKEGRMRGFQLWLNLPAAEKMKPAAYRDIPAAQIPEVTTDGGTRVRVIAGALRAGDDSVYGPINGDGDGERMATDPLYLDVTLPAGGVFEQPVKPGHNAFAFVFEGDASVEGQPLPHHAAGIFGDGDRVRIDAGDAGARMLLLAGRPIGEPVAQYGPFVMNTTQEIERAIRDFQAGQLTA